MEISWSEIKRIADEKGLDLQWIDIGDNYLIKLIDGSFILDCVLSKDQATEFEDTYKNNNPKKSLSGVQTRFERDDLILKIARAKADVDENGEALIELKVPGVMAQGGCRWIDGGKAFFDVGHAGDAVIEVAIVDKDNVLGYGANTVLKTYHDDECDLENQGWYIYPTRPLEIETLGYYGQIPSELYLVIKAKKAAGHESGTFFCNMFWGEISV